MLQSKILRLTVFLNPQRYQIFQKSKTNKQNQPTCLSLVSFDGFNTGSTCSHQIQILPNNWADCEVRWKRRTYLNAGMELNEQHEYRDLLSSIPFPYYPSNTLCKQIRFSLSGLLFIHHNQSHECLASRKGIMP